MAEPCGVEVLEEVELVDGLGCGADALEVLLVDVEVLR